MSRRRRALPTRVAPLLVGVLLAACGPPDIYENATPDPITIGQTCGRVQVEQGNAGPCATLADALAHYAEVYVARWGAPAPDVIIAGTAYFATKTIDVLINALVVVPHEMRHVALGPASKDHHGWCDEFCGWEFAALQFDEHEYLGCPAPGDRMPR